MSAAFAQSRAKTHSRLFESI